MSSREHRTALLATGDASWWQRIRARWQSAPKDARDEEEFRQIRAGMSAFQDLPPYFAWDTLAREMKANILLGVEAGEIVRPRRLHAPIGLRAGLAMAALTLLMISGYWWQMPHRWRASRPDAQAVLQAAPGQLGVGQVGVENQESGFALVFQSSAGNSLVSGASGAVRADYVDSETGQLTVAHVYLD